MNFTTKEKQAIRNTIKLLIKDMRKLVENYPEPIIKVFAFQEVIDKYGDIWYLEITDKEIVIRDQHKDSNSLIARKNKRNIVLDEYDYIAQYHFIRNYDSIRGRIEELVTKRQKQIDDNIDMINSTRSKYIKKLAKEKKHKKATIEIDLPPTNNQYELEIKEENGQTIGHLNFNGLTLTILASEGVKIINKPQNKQKNKKKGTVV